MNNYKNLSFDCKSNLSLTKIFGREIFKSESGRKMLLKSKRPEIGRDNVGVKKLTC